MDINEVVLKTMTESNNPLKAGEIAELAGIDKKEVDKAIKVLKNEGKVISPKVCYYTIKQ
ncbi:MAG TPA: MarR family transcriptional regulator [Clostridiales bacterium]|nr:MAG: MarR family transcriptional regulator [Clostridiales bacterium GWD2_32_59]HAN09603.1 MarR family transcriptional regulator [Clostridiales bacterium]